MNYAEPVTLRSIDRGPLGVGLNAIELSAIREATTSSTRPSENDRFWVNYAGNESLHLTGHPRRLRRLFDFVAQIAATSKIARPFLEEYRYITLVEKVASFRSLLEGWDGNSAPIPSEAAIRTSLSIMKSLRDAGALPSNARATADGSILLDLHTSSGRHFFETFEDGDVVLVEEAGSSSEKVSDFDIGNTSEVFARLLNARK